MRLAGLVVCGMLVAGCQAHLYNQENDKQAALLKEKIAAVKFDDTFKTARDNHKVLSDSILQSDLRASQLRAQFDLLQVIAKPMDDSTSGLSTVIAKRWDELAKPVRLDSSAIGQTLVEGLEAYDPQSQPARFLRGRKLTLLIRVTAKIPDCAAKTNADGSFQLDPQGRPVPALPAPADIVKGVPPDQVGSVQADYNGFVSACRTLLVKQHALDRLFERDGAGEIAMALKAWRRQNAIHTAATAAIGQLKSNYEALDKQYKDALEDIKKKQPQAEEKAKDLLKKAGEALEKLAEVQDNDVAKDLGLAMVSEERIAKLEEILALLNAGEKTPESEQKLSEDVRGKLTVIAGLPSMVDSVSELYAAASKARLTPLKLELAVQQQILIAAQRNLAHELSEVDFLRRVYLSRLRAALQIHDAHAFKTGLSKDFPRDKPLYDAMGGDLVKAEDRKKLLNALANLYRADAKYLAMGRAAPIEAAARVYQRNLDADESALAEWKSLIDGETAILSEYHAAGVKPESLGQLASLLALIWIGVGVN